jgi:FixJ family two-component response regulator
VKPCARCHHRPRRPYHAWCLVCHLRRTCDCGRAMSYGATQCVQCLKTPERLREVDVAQSTREGRSAAQIAAELGVAERTVCRIRARLRAEGRLEN